MCSIRKAETAQGQCRHMDASFSIGGVDSAHIITSTHIETTEGDRLPHSYSGEVDPAIHLVFPIVRGTTIYLLLAR
jgi:hypothetical protein